jgi:hypothetical protein
MGYIVTRSVSEAYRNPKVSEGLILAHASGYDNTPIAVDGVKGVPHADEDE